jgi:hypothetical protein
MHIEDVNRSLRASEQETKKLGYTLIKMHNDNLSKYSLSVRIILIYNYWRNKALSNLKSTKKRYNSDDVLRRVRSFEISSDPDVEPRNRDYLSIHQATLGGQRRASCSPVAGCSLNSLFTYFHSNREESSKYF